MTTQVSLSYQINLRDPFSLAALHTLAAGVNLDLIRTFAAIGCAFVSDATVDTVGPPTFVTRTIVASFFPTANLFPVLAAPPRTAGFRGTIVSSSPADAANGAGMAHARIDFVDALGQPGFEEVAMKGTAPVVLEANHKLTIVAITPMPGNPAPVGLIAVSTGSPVNRVVQGDRAGQVLANFTGSILSTSNDDQPGGAGATTATIHYNDVLGVPQTPQVVGLTGQTPVVLPLSNHAVITAVTTDKPSTGAITIYTGDDVPALLPSGAPAAQIPPSFSSSFPLGTDQTCPFVGLFTQALAAGVGGIVIPALPVVS
jgi:hypothetical protein